MMVALLYPLPGCSVLSSILGFLVFLAGVGLVLGSLAAGGWLLLDCSWALELWNLHGHADRPIRPQLLMQAVCSPADGYLSYLYNLTETGE